MAHNYLCVETIDDSIAWYDNGKLCCVPAQLLLFHTLRVWSDQWLDGEGMYLTGVWLVAKEDGVCISLSWGASERCRWSITSVSSQVLMTSMSMTVTWQTLAMRKIDVQNMLGVKLSERRSSRA